MTLLRVPWRHHISTRILFGTGALDLLVDVLRGFSDARRVLIVGGRFHFVKSGVADVVKEIVIEAGKEPFVYSKVPAEPSVEAVDEAFSFAKTVWPHLVLGVGGGSALDVAKVVSMLLTNPGDVSSLIGIYEPFSRDGLPFIAVPTTSGSGSEVTPYSVIVDPVVPRKAPVVSSRSFPHYAVDDPHLTISCPPELTARAGVDALSHCVEAFLSRKATPFTDLVAKEGMKLVFRYLHEAVENGNRLETRGEMMLASLYGGMAIAEAGAGLIHQLGHALAVFNYMPHGRAMGLFMRRVLEFYGDSIRNKLEEMAFLAGVEFCDFLPWLEEWLCSLGMPSSLGEVGYHPEWGDLMVDLVMSRKSVMENLPVVPTSGLLKDLLDGMA